MIEKLVLILDGTSLVIKTPVAANTVTEADSCKNVIFKDRGGGEQETRQKDVIDSLEYRHKRAKDDETEQNDKKNNTRDSNVVPHRSSSLARQCLTSLSRREAVLSLWYGRS